MNSRIIRTIYESRFITMFDEMRNAINAAENVLSHLQWRKSSIVSSLDVYNNREDELTDWELSEKKQYVTELDLIIDIEKHIQKWVKSQI